MVQVDVVNINGEKVSEIELEQDVFNITVKPSILHEVVTMQLANRRAGSASVKRRSDVKGSTRKLFRQKGTGRARRGDIKSPLLRGGGVVFGPSPKSYKYKVPKKVRRLALKMALSSKLQEEKIVVLDKLALDEIKTKKFVKILDGLNRKNVLLVTCEEDEKLELSSRNVPKVKVIRAERLNVYDILKYDNLILLKASIEDIEGRLTP
mmetsp:Transcript_22319/g.10706  ORF Transcript_22319/g.10706 Transcript_22319/m.10706 type:complete len:208 (+) Transcript_22319:1053-1676(+)